VWLVTVLAFFAVTTVLPGFRIDTSVPHWWLVLVRLPLVFTLLLIVLRPLLLFLTLPLNSLTLGAPTLLFNGLILWIAAGADPALSITNYGEALLGMLAMTALSSGITGWLGVDEAYPFYQSIIYRAGLRFGPRTERKPLRGLLILQIDGLSLHSLRHAMNKGRVPTISAMMAKGSHRLFGWHCGIPSNTPAVQAGFFYGNRHNVPGYRWFDRASQEMKVVSNPDVLRELEEMVAAEGEEPLLKGGSCINTFLTGGAAKRLMAVTALGEESSRRRDGEHADFNLFFLSPFDYTKAVLGSLWDYLSGLVMAVAGLMARDRPRLKFSIKRLAQRTLANAFLRDLSFFWLKQDMVRGVPVIYSNFVGYDDIAHHSGPDTYEAQISLAAFDRRLRTLQRRARRQSPIRYEIILLSDHGQTESLPFRYVEGEGIEETLSAILDEVQGRATRRQSPHTFNPDRSYALTLLRQLEEVEPSRRGWVADRGRRALAAVTREDEVAGDSDEAPGVAVCVSGSLAHVYFTGHRNSLQLEDIVARYPGFIEAVARHPGIGFVAASRRFGDAVALCDGGVRNLITGRVGEDRDPLAPYANRARWGTELAELLSYPDSGDLVIHGAWLADRERIVVLEEQTSSHGGLGGPQTEPFLVAPAAWDVTDRHLDSPEGLYRLVSRQMGQYRPSSGAENGREYPI
jgi:uncharacterized membrane protein YvlD (DUF360 family)